VSVTIKPLEDRVLVAPLEAEQTTKSGLVIPDTAKEKPQEGEILAVGPGRIDDNGNRVPLDVKVGDKVIYSKYGGTEVKYDGQDYLILGARALAFLRGRQYALPQDVAEIAPDVIRHRLVLTYAGIASGVTSETILAALLGRFPPPRIDLGDRYAS